MNRTFLLLLLLLMLSANLSSPAPRSASDGVNTIEQEYRKPYFCGSRASPGESPR